MSVKRYLNNVVGKPKKKGKYPLDGKTEFAKYGTYRVKITGEKWEVQFTFHDKPWTTFQSGEGVNGFLASALSVYHLGERE
jgi:hypothetical protein